MFTEDEFENEEKLVPYQGNAINKPITDSKTTANETTEENQEHTRKRTRPLLTEKIAQEKKLEIEKEIKAAKKKKPKNLLFTTGYSSEESLDAESDEEDKEDKGVQ